jgi:hypothetical protein
VNRIAAAALAALCLALPATASAKHRFPEHQRDRYMTVANCVPTPSVYHARMRGWIGAAAWRWSKATNFEVRVVACASRTPEVKVYAGRYGNTGWEGLSGWGRSNGHMRDGVTKINLSYPNAEWRAAVVAHELGHQAGLKHSNERGSTMNQPPWSSIPAPHDYAMIKSIYAHSR